MFLIQIMLASLLGSVAMASATIPGNSAIRTKEATIPTGTFVLDQRASRGEFQDCEDKVLVKVDQTFLHVGQEAVRLAPTQARTRSEFDPNCEFRTESTRRETREKTVYAKLNSEVCRGKVKSENLLTLTVEPNQVSIEREYKLVPSLRRAAPGYSCVYVKRSK